MSRPVIEPPHPRWEASTPEKCHSNSLLLAIRNIYIWASDNRTKIRTQQLNSSLMTAYLPGRHERTSLRPPAGSGRIQSLYRSETRYGFKKKIKHKIKIIELLLEATHVFLQVFRDIFFCCAKYSEQCSRSGSVTSWTSGACYYLHGSGSFRLQAKQFS